MSFSLLEPEPVVLDRSRLREGPQVPDPLNPQPSDVIQGQIAACPIAAAMIAMAHARPGALGAILGAAIGDDVFSRRRGDEIFSHWSTFYYEVRFRHGTPVRISPVLYFRDGQIAYASTPNGAGWPSYVEKAYAVWRGRNSYNGLNEGSSFYPVPDGGRVMDDLAGPPDMAHLTTNRFYTRQGGEVALTAATLTRMLGQATRRPTMAASLEEGAEAPIVSNHGYAVLRFANGRVSLRNPHGGPDANVRMTLAAFTRAFQAVWQSA